MLQRHFKVNKANKINKATTQKLKLGFEIIIITSIATESCQLTIKPIHRQRSQKITYASYFKKNSAFSNFFIVEKKTSFFKQNSKSKFFLTKLKIKLFFEK